MRFFAGWIAVAAAILTAASPAAQPPAEPLAVARVLAAKYPAQPVMSYIPALSWSGQLRLFQATGEAPWRDKAMKDLAAFTSGRTAPIAEPYRLTSLAGALAFHDAWTIERDASAQKVAMEVAAFMTGAPGDSIKFATGWTDDMFMASAVLSRVGLAPHLDLVHRLLTDYAKRLQRPDGLFVHAANGPHAWGRGNGFALLGVTEALTYLPPAWTGRAPVLEIYRRHVAALVTHQSDDGSWRQVVDEPASYRELTVTAMTVAALARGIARGWIDRAAYEPIVNRGWAAVAARVNADGTVKDVCSGTGAGETKEYYLNRPVVNGADDRGGAMALLAAIEMESMRRTPR
jgi:rhamnogalacturonyl hydrolase YesR